MTDRYEMWLAARYAADALRVQTAFVAVLVVAWWISLGILPDKFIPPAKVAFIITGVMTYAAIYIYCVWALVDGLVLSR